MSDGALWLGAVRDSRRSHHCVLLSAKLAASGDMSVRPEWPAWCALACGRVAAACVADPADVVVFTPTLERLGRLCMPAPVAALAPLDRGPFGAVVAALRSGGALVCDADDDALVPMRRRQMQQMQQQHQSQQQGQQEPELGHGTQLYNDQRQQMVDQHQHEKQQQREQQQSELQHREQQKEEKQTLEETRTKQRQRVGQHGEKQDGRAKQREHQLIEPDHHEIEQELIQFEENEQHEEAANQRETGVQEPQQKQMEVDLQRPYPKEMNEQQDMPRQCERQNDQGQPLPSESQQNLEHLKRVTLQDPSSQRGHGEGPRSPSEATERNDNEQLSRKQHAEGPVEHPRHQKVLKAEKANVQEYEPIQLDSDDFSKPKQEQPSTDTNGELLLGSVNSPQAPGQPCAPAMAQGKAPLARLAAPAPLSLPLFLSVAETIPPVAFAALYDGRVIAWPLAPKAVPFSGQTIWPQEVLRVQRTVTFTALDAAPMLIDRPGDPGRNGCGNVAIVVVALDSGYAEVLHITVRECGASGTSHVLIAQRCMVYDRADSSPYYTPSREASRFDQSKAALSSLPRNVACDYGRILGVSWAGNGRVVFGGEDDGVYMVDIARGMPRCPVGCHRSYAASVAIRGDLVASAGWDGRLMLWSLSEASDLAGMHTNLSFDDGVELMALETGRTFWGVEWPQSNVLLVSSCESSGRCLLHRIDLVTDDESDENNDSYGTGGIRPDLTLQA